MHFFLVKYDEMAALGKYIVLGQKDASSAFYSSRITYQHYMPN